jgi:CheY-like chemotaxis protein
MVVDDDEGVRLVLRKVLEKEGYSISEAGSGKECLEKFDKVQPDLVLLDIMIPGMDGWNVCRSIKQRKSRVPVPVSMLSVRRGEEDVRRSLEYARADAHLTKPFNLDELRSTVSSLLM